MANNLTFYKQIKIDFAIKNFIETLYYANKTDNTLTNYHNFLKNRNPIFTEGFYSQIQNFMDVLDYDELKNNYSINEDYKSLVIKYEPIDLLTLDISMYMTDFVNIKLKNTLTDISNILTQEDLYYNKMLHFYKDVVDNKLEDIKSFFHEFIDVIMEDSNIKKILLESDNVNFNNIIKNSLLDNTKNSVIVDAVKQKLTDDQQNNIKKIVSDFFSEIENKQLFCKIILSELIFILIKNTENKNVQTKFKILSDSIKEILLEFKTTERELYNNYILNYKELFNIAYNYITNDESVKFYEIVQVVNKILPYNNLLLKII